MLDTFSCSTFELYLLLQIMRFELITTGSTCQINCCMCLNRPCWSRTSTHRVKVCCPTIRLRAYKGLAKSRYYLSSQLKFYPHRTNNRGGRVQSRNGLIQIFVRRAPALKTSIYQTNPKN